MKKTLWLLVALVVLCSSFAFAEEVTTNEEGMFDPNYVPSLEEAIQVANEEVLEVTGVPGFYDLSQVNRDMYDKYGVIVYGEPHGDTKGSESRYVGYTPDGEPFGNPVFPRDSWAGGTFDERNWIAEPWTNTALREQFGIKHSAFNGTEEFADNMRAGLLKYYPEDTDGSRTDWHKYMQILQPPTEYAPGMARMWHVNENEIFL